MYGRKNYFFNPPGGNQSIRYIEPYIYQDYGTRQPVSPLYPAPFQTQYGPTNWNNTQHPYPMQVNQYPHSYQNQLTNTNEYAGHPYMMNQGFSKAALQNPLQAQDEPYPGYYPQQMPGQGAANPYPNPAMMPKQPGGFQNIMNSFKSQDGSMDINKMVNTAGQMINAISQVKSMVSGLGGMLKV